MSNPLDLYSKVEDLLGVHEVTPHLYANYIETLKEFKFSSLLDVGCGRGAFLVQVGEEYPTAYSMGIDLSQQMVKVARDKGVEVYHTDLCDVNKKFDIITAVFDMLNYLDDNELDGFMLCVENHLTVGGYFICDINSFYAFAELAVGAFIKDDNDRFVTIDSDFDDIEYISEFTLFEKSGNKFKKSQETIFQYYHTVERLEESTNLKLMSQKGISVYGDEVEKYYLIFKKIKGLK
jgi:cyclopropane fatty-acyl-phospholipid synthase-like methyltransferase